MNQKDNKKKKFENVDSYKSLFNKEKNENYLDILSLQTLTTLNEMNNLDYEFKKYEIKFSDDEKSILNLSFKELKWLLWTRFCTQIRDYSETIFALLYYYESDDEIKNWV